MKLLILISIFSFISCSRETEPINFGKDICDHCKMTIMDKKFGGEIITGKGKIIKFDAIECMVKYEIQSSSTDKLDSYTINYSVPGELLKTDNSAFVISENISSPMGANLGSFGNKSDAENFIKKNGGEMFDWISLKEKIKKK